MGRSPSWLGGGRAGGREVDRQLSLSEHMISCLSAQKTFFAFKKRARSFKIFSKSAEML